MRRLAGTTLVILFVTTSASAVLTADAVAQEKCSGLRAQNGRCADAALIDDAQNRAMIMTTVRNSYFGTPAGTFGGAFIPFERLFRDNPQVFGLPTYTYSISEGGGITSIGRTK